MSDIPTTEELVRYLAVEGMGWTPSPTDPGYYYDKNGTRYFPQFGTDANDTEMLIEALARKGIPIAVMPDPNDGYVARNLKYYGPPRHNDSHADNMKTAVCHAAYMAIKAEKGL